MCCQMHVQLILVSRFNAIRYSPRWKVAKDVVGEEIVEICYNGPGLCKSPDGQLA